MPFCKDRKAELTAGLACHVFQAVFLPTELKKETVSQPVKAWKRGKLAAYLGPKDSAISPAKIKQNFLPVE